MKIPVVFVADIGSESRKGKKMIRLQFIKSERKSKYKFTELLTKITRINIVNDYSTIMTCLCISDFPFIRAVAPANE